MRIFGGTGLVSANLRRYAAFWGITLVDPELWPAPVARVFPDGLARA